MRVPKRGTGADQPVVVKKSRNGDGAKGLDHPALPFWSTSNGRSHCVRQGRVIAVDPWEPDESRDSSPVLRGRGGEIPPRYSTFIRYFRKL